MPSYNNLTSNNRSKCLLITISLLKMRQIPSYDNRISNNRNKCLLITISLFKMRQIPFMTIALLTIETNAFL